MLCWTTSLRLIAPRLALAAVLLSAIAGGSASQDAVSDQARRIAHQSKEEFLRCLADEAKNVLPRKLDVQEFVIFIKARCHDAIKQFRIALMDYILALD